jgi:hypothetical protein
MSQTNFSKILIYGSATPDAEPLPANLESSVNGAELALNYADGKLFYKDATGAVQLLASKNGISPVTDVTATAPLTATNTAGVIDISLTGNIPNTQITGLGTMSVQNANAVAITGGTAILTSVTTPLINDPAGALNVQANGVTKLQVESTGVFVTQDPTENLQVATKQYVDGAITGGVKYKGLWDADTNTPTLESGVGIAGELYVVSVAGNTDLDGTTDWELGNWALYDGTAWQKLDYAPLVLSVNGQTGVVTLTASDIGGLGTMAVQNANAVAITGGAMNNTIIGATTPALVTATVMTATQYVGISAGSFA